MWCDYDVMSFIKYLIHILIFHSRIKTVPGSRLTVLVLSYSYVSYNKLCMQFDRFFRRSILIRFCDTLERFTSHSGISSIQPRRISADLGYIHY